MKAIIGKKVGMSQIFDENGHVIPVTVIEAGPCVVTQKKTTEKDGYEAVQLGYEDVAEKKLSKPEVGHLNKAGVSPKKYLREFDLDNGYEGVVKRCGYAIQRKSHGGGPVHRHVGSRGSGTDPSRIFKGTGGPGQMGGETVTIQNLEVVKVDPELNMLVVRGAIPGPKFSLVTVKNTVKTHKVKQAGAGISSNPQKASGRNPQKASARTK